MKIGPETLEQITLFEWIELQFPYYKDYFMHIPLERKCSIQQGAILKRMGVRAGCADIFAAIPTNRYHGLFIEMKYGKNRLTPNQIMFLDNMNAQGYKAVCCYGFEEARNAILEYLR